MSQRSKLKESIPLISFFLSIFLSFSSQLLAKSLGPSCSQIFERDTSQNNLVLQNHYFEQIRNQQLRVVNFQSHYGTEAVQKTLAQLMEANPNYLLFFQDEVRPHAAALEGLRRAAFKFNLKIFLMNMGTAFYVSFANSNSITQGALTFSILAAVGLTLHNIAGKYFMPKEIERSKSFAKDLLKHKAKDLKSSLVEVSRQSSFVLRVPGVMLSSGPIAVIDAANSLSGQRELTILKEDVTLVSDSNNPYRSRLHNANLDIILGEDSNGESKLFLAVTTKPEERTLPHSKWVNFTNTLNEIDSFLSR